MAAAAISTYADSQIKKIAEKLGKIDAKDKDAAARRARLASACMKWMRLKHLAR